MISSCFNALAFTFIPTPEVCKTRDIRGFNICIATVTCQKKKLKGGPLRQEDKANNRALAKARIGIEHVNGRLKTFRILAERYRNRYRRFGLRCNLIAALHNLEYAQAA